MSTNQHTSQSTSKLAPVLEHDGPNSIAKDLAEQYEDFHGVIRETIADPDAARGFLVLPQGKRVESLKPILDQYRTAPERRSGTATLRDVDSFIAHVLRHKDADSVVFAAPDPGAPSITAIFDYNRAGGHEAEKVARFGKHRAVYKAPLSREWQAWTQAAGRGLSGQEFAEFLDAHITDVIAAPAELPEHLREWSSTVGGRFASAAQLRALSLNLSVNVETKVRQATTLETGEVAMTYEEQHTDGQGAPVRIANLFLVALPVFYAGVRWTVPVRLRYRLSNGRVQWTFALHQVDAVFDAAFQEVADKVRTETGLPLFLGAPEA